MIIYIDYITALIFGFFYRLIMLRSCDYHEFDEVVAIEEKLVVFCSFFEEGTWIKCKFIYLK